MTSTTWGARDEAARELERRVGLRAERDALLAAHTTMRVGGPADLLVTVRDRFTLRGVVRLAQSKGWPLRILGRGSNVVVSDAGIHGIVLLNRSADVTVDAASATISADSGLSMAKLSTIAAEAGLTGAEFTLAIPGNLGGAIWANAGAHGGEMSQILQRVVIMRQDGSEEELAPDALNLSYRHSRFKEANGGGEVILGATMLLEAGEPAQIKAQLEEIRRWRREHQPLGIPSAGSVFRNPPEGPSAGALIEAAGLKGRAIGGAEVSTMHANWILNRGGATAADIRELHDLCIREVREKSGITLMSEIQFIGEEPA
jgi:UDP-N-acetylmuramate dehydrogenase